MRVELEYLQSKIEVLDPFIPKKTLRSGISRIRKLITTPEARYPKRPEMYQQFLNVDFQKVAQLVEFTPQYATIEVKQLVYFLNYPRFYNETFDERNPPLDDEGNPMMNFEQWCGYRLKQLQKETQHLEYEQAHVDKGAKKTRTLYKNYCKEWKKKWLSK